jgi:hypothetical protein
LVTYSKFNWNREEITASFLGNFLASWNTWEVDESWSNDAFLSVETLEDCLSESNSLLVDILFLH